MTNPVPPPVARARPGPAVPGARAGAGHPVRQVLARHRRPRRTSARLLACLGVGVLAAVILPFRDLGLGTFLVLLAAGGVILGFSVNRRSPFTLACAGLCVLLAATVVVRDARVDRGALPAGRRRALRGRARERAHPARLRAGRRSPGRSPGCAGSRGWVARCAPSPVLGLAHRRAAHGRAVAARGRGLRAAVRLGRRGLRRVGGRDHPEPRARLVRAAGVRHHRGRRRGAGGDVPRPEPAERRAGRRLRCGRSRTATSG